MQFANEAAVQADRDNTVYYYERVRKYPAVLE